MSDLHVTTVVLRSAEGAVSAFLSSARSFSGSMRQSLPKHSATTFLTRDAEFNSGVFYRK